MLIKGYSKKKPPLLDP